MSLDGSVAIVTGGTRGVGRELARQGARVFITGRSAPDHERLDERITGIRCDHRVDTQVEAAFNLIRRETSAIDILVNFNPGLSPFVLVIFRRNNSELTAEYGTT